MKTAIVTGGTKGIGKEITASLLKRGYRVIATYGHDAIEAQKAMVEFSAISSAVSIEKVDQSISGEIGRFSRLVREQWSHVDCIVCNAGMTLRRPAMEISDEEWEAVMRVTVDSHYYLIRDLYDRIVPGARILFIGSMLGIVPHATSLPYGVAKAALHALAKNLVKEFENTGTTVNIIAPGFVETEWQKNKPQEIRENIYRKTAIKRFAAPSEIAQAAEFCLDNAFVNGSVIEVNGGYSFK